MEPKIPQYIETRPEKCDGRPCISGTRIRVQDIVCDHEIHGLTPEQIAREYPQITLSQVHAALAYYFDCRDEIRGHIKEDQKLVAAFRDTANREPRRTLTSKDADADPFSPG